MRRCITTHNIVDNWGPFQLFCDDSWHTDMLTPKRSESLPYSNSSLPTPCRRFCRRPTMVTTGQAASCISKRRKVAGVPGPCPTARMERVKAKSLPRIREAAFSRSAWRTRGKVDIYGSSWRHRAASIWIKSTGRLCIKRARTG